MKLSMGIAGACVVGIAGGTAWARQGVATYSIAFGTPGGTNSVFLLPGQTVDVFVNVSFSPGVGQPHQNGTVLGLADGGFSINSTGPGNLWGVDSNTTSATYSLPNPWGAQGVGGLGVHVGTPSASGVSGVVWGYGFLLSSPHPFPQNPANVWRGTYTCGAEPSVSTITFTNLDPTAVYISVPGSGIPTLATFSSVGGTGFIQRIPSPGAPAAMALGAFALGRRRRSRG